MEFRPSRGRGGWRRGRGGGDGGDGGEHRGRGGRGAPGGRGGPHRGRGRKQQHRGRGGGGGGGGGGAEFRHRAQDEEDSFEPEDERTETFSRRKLESNWDRYAESEKAEAVDATPTQRGTDFHVLLESAGDSFTQFRLAEEKDWDTDSFEASQMSAVFLDLVELTQCLRQVPLHQRLELEAELVQVSTPVDLPAMNVAPKQDTPKSVGPAPPTAVLKGLDAVRVAVATNPAPGSDVGLQDVDEELDQLLSLQKPVSENQFVRTEDENLLPGKPVSEEVEPVAPEEKDETVAPPPVKQEMTEEDLEDWLDSMIS